MHTVRPSQPLGQLTGELSSLFDEVARAPYQNLDRTLALLNHDVRRNESAFSMSIATPKTLALAQRADQYKVLAHSAVTPSEADDYAIQAIGYQVQYLIATFRLIAATKLTDTLSLIEHHNWVKIPQNISSKLTSAQLFFKQGRDYQKVGNADAARANFLRAIRLTEEIDMTIFRKYERNQLARVWIFLFLLTFVAFLISN